MAPHDEEDSRQSVEGRSAAENRVANAETIDSDSDLDVTLASQKSTTKRQIASLPSSSSSSSSSSTSSDESSSSSSSSTSSDSSSPSDSSDDEVKYRISMKYTSV